MSDELANQIIGGIVGTVAAGFIGLLVYYIRSRQGNRIIVKRVSNTSQIKISDVTRKMLTMAYGDVPMDILVFNTFVIYNDGNQIIEPVEFIFEVKHTVRSAFDLLEVEDPKDITGIESSDHIDGKPDFIFKRPYLNPLKKFKNEEVKLFVISATEPTFSIYGGGKGWYVKYVDAKNKKRFWDKLIQMKLLLPY